LNDLISELIRVNQPLVAGNAANIGGPRTRSGKDRAHSEKTANNGQQNQGYNQAHLQASGGANPAFNHHQPNVGNFMSSG